MQLHHHYYIIAAALLLLIIMATRFFGRNSTPSRPLSGQRISASSALELISSQEPHERPRRNLGRNAPIRSSTFRNNENMLPYRPGMLLNDQPPVYNSESECEGDEERVYNFNDVQNCNPEITEIKLMVQQQQAMMRSILTNQEAIQERQATFEKKVTELEEKLVHYSPSSSDGSPSASKKRKRIVSRGISVSILCG